MSITTTSIALYAGLAFFDFGGIGDDLEEAVARAVCTADGLLRSEVSGVDHSFSDAGPIISENVFGQAVTYNGSDPGHIRFDGDRIAYQESHNETHPYAEDVDILQICDIEAAFGLGVGSVDFAEVGTFDKAPTAQTDIHVISFANTYQNPVLFTQVTTYNGSHPILAVPVTVFDDGAVIALFEPDNYDGNHASETVSWMVIEKGQHTLADGSVAAVGSLEVTTTTYDGSDFGRVVPIVEGPNVYVQDDRCLENTTVLASPQHVVDSDYHGTRVIKNIGSGGELESFDLRHMRRQAVEDANPPTATSGTIGYLVIGDESSVDCTREEDGHFQQYYGFGDFGDAGDAPSSVPPSIINELCGAGSETDALWSQSDEWGGNVAGAGYAVRVGLQDTRDDGGELWMGGEADADITLLGDTFTVFDIGAEATEDAGGNTDSRMWLEAVGGIVDFEEALEVDLSPNPFTVTFFQATGFFYGVTVTGSVEGELGLDVTVGVTTDLELDVRPYAVLYGTASASVGVACASAGVSASLTFVEVGVPVTAAVSLTGAGDFWSVTADLELVSLDGSLDLNISWCVGSESHNLFEIDGFDTTYALLDEGGCL